MEHGIVEDAAFDMNILANYFCPREEQLLLYFKSAFVVLQASEALLLGSSSSNLMLN